MTDLVARACAAARGGARTTAGVSFVPVVTYRYQVRGRGLESQRLAWARAGASTREAASTALAPFPVGATVTAFVDPDEPTSVVLDRTPPSMVGLAIPGVLVAVGAGIVLVGLRGRR